MSKQRWLYVRRIAFGLVAWAALAGSAQPGFIVSPNAEATTEGNINSGFPFNLPFFGLTSMRYQQVYSSGDFASLGGPMYVTQIAFRPDASNGNAFSATTLANTQISLSTTSKPPDGSTAQLRRQSRHEQYARLQRQPHDLQQLHWGSGRRAQKRSMIPRSTCRGRSSTTPRQGNLLMEEKTSGQSAFTSELDAESTAGGSVSRLYNTDNNANGTSGFLDTLGLVTRFEFAPVPEPSSVVLLGVGTLGLLVWSWRRR